MNIEYILLTTNEAFAQHCAVCISSLIANNSDTFFSIVIASLELSNDTKEKLSSMTEPNRCSINLVEFDKNKLDALPQIGYYSKDIYLRLWVDEFFADSTPDKVLYLDADTITVDSLDELWQLDMQDNLLAAVDIPDSTSHNRCHLPLDIGYFNSGVLLFNVPLWKKERCLEQIITFLNDNKAIALNPDQDALNGLFYNRRITLDYTYNAISPFFRKAGFPSLTREALSTIRKNVKIVHFNGKARPWLFSCNHPYQQKYLQYLATTPWKASPLEEKSFVMAIKKKLRIFLNKETFVQIKKLKGQ
ncbi:glycosyltransferase family 8 protein [Flavobacterium sp. W21_SRS_FM6]|uniref:glycosyltransferase family 8 protein n=1 Tax=Flavobacterium sp. W21_SRS_FM6 TaxID=3240268 RepID=UPI003F8E410C